MVFRVPGIHAHCPVVDHDVAVFDVGYFVKFDRIGESRADVELHARKLQSGRGAI